MRVTSPVSRGTSPTVTYRVVIVMSLAAGRSSSAAFTRAMPASAPAVSTVTLIVAESGRLPSSVLIFAICCRTSESTETAKRRLAPMISRIAAR
ncbi:MAG TPA: hypothetical protein VKV80_19945 [Streptosporangiaceae bacterium]|nr:hypothetical protein [Streptosporangiaceae bacterium]